MPPKHSKGEKVKIGNFALICGGGKLRCRGRKWRVLTYNHKHVHLMFVYAGGLCTFLTSADTKAKVLVRMNKGLPNQSL